jgi:hypothetical protein
LASKIFLQVALASEAKPFWNRDIVKTCVSETGASLVN